MKNKVIALICVILVLLSVFVWEMVSAPDIAKLPVQKADTLNQETSSDNNDLSQNIEINKKTDEASTELLPPTTDVLPESAEKATKENENLTCTLSIRCDTILNNLSMMKEEKRSIVPANGIIYSKKDVVFYDGESVFNVVLRETKQNKIHFEFEITPIYESAYIKGIANLYEFDCGELSGWLYKVNGVSPSAGCSLYELKPGDCIEISYTCNMGKDLGDSYVGI
ncbi:MAG: DUF4430 domain-containing protein [Clostridia bacterium]|nr:DUF4430 domain-containing protein [Clostridia bacterium]